MEKSEVVAFATIKNWIKDWISFVKNPSQQQYYDQKRVKEIEDFVNDTIPGSINDILQKAVDIELETSVKKGLIVKVEKGGRAYYKKVV